MITKIFKNFRLIAYYLLVITLLCGCASTPTVSVPGVKETVLIDGTRYVFAKSFAEIYNLDRHWDPIARKLILKKGDKEVRMLVDSSTVLLNNEVRTMDKEVRFYRGMVVIPQSFTRRTLASFFREKEHIESKAIPSSLGLPIRKVIIDPGHGGKEPGAVGKRGLKEKDVVLDIAKRLKNKLNASGIDAILTRTSDKTVSLSQRSKIANAKAEEADFFISIHANASRARWVSGVEVFYLSESVDDNLRSLKTSKNYDLNLEESFSGKHTPAIIWDLLFTEYRRESKKLAYLVCKTLSKSLHQKDRGIKQARFYVLRTNVPAVLVEVGFISNAREEKRLRDASYRDKIAQGIAKGVVEYNRKFTPLEVRGPGRLSR